MALPMFIIRVALLVVALAVPGFAGDASINYPPKAGPSQGKHIVLITGDEEYRSEEGLPMLGKILSQRHGFKCTVLFSVDPDGTINPNANQSLPDSAALDSADAIVMLLRYRAWGDEAMKRFIAAYERGVPIIALRTSTHAFNFPGNSPYRSYNKFGENVIGEEWVSHWGVHKKEATLGIIEPSVKNDPIFREVADIFGDTDVYEAYPPADAKILVRGQVLKGMKATDPPADYKKKRATDKQEQGVNDPMMPVAWSRLYKNEKGKENKIFTTTMGSATDLQNEGMRRLVVNAVYWGLGMNVPPKADVTYVDEFKPTMYGFGGYRRGLKPSDHAIGKVLPQGNPPEKKAEPPKAAATKAATLKLKKGDHIAIVGNALPDRMQHSGHLETLIHAKHPEHDLVVRNLAFAGDEVVTRHRSENFGSPDEWLKKVETDVVFAFFGYNESFAGYEGLEKFKGDLDKYLKATLKNNYSGRGTPRVVLFSPTADEKHQDPSYPDPELNNQRLQDYTSAMADVAAANGVQFVNLFKPSQQFYTDAAKQKRSLTVNGHYLTEEADKLLAPVMFQSIFGEPAPTSNEKLRGAVNEKNAEWHARYRTIDGYNVYGGRSKLAFEDGKGGPKISNFHIMQEEMSQRDVLTANRDKRVWAVAKGGDLKVDDSNLPSVTKIKSNKPGPNPDESHVFLSGDEAIKKMTVHSGMKVNLFASEERFPELINPVQMTWDTRGRLWVAAWANYPERTPDSKKGDSLLVFEDTNGDGKADKYTAFLDDLNAPTGFQFYKDGVLVVQAPDVWFVRDTNGDGKGDWKERVLMGLDSADSHHTANAICHEPGGAIYLSDGVFHRTQVETASGVVRNNDAAIYRFEPNTGKFETHISYGFANPHGRVFDYWGNDLVTDATGNNTYFGPAFSGRIDYPKKHANMNQFWDRPSRPCPGTGILSSRHFPDEFQGNFLNLNVISFQGIYRVKVTEEGSGLKGQTLEHLVHSSDPNFRPSAVSIGPDGAIYFTDWHNPIIGHMQHHLRDPNRNKVYGRIYRITYEGRPLLKPKKIHGQAIPALLDLLKEHEDSVRELAKVELSTRDSQQVIAAVKKWAAALDKNDAAYEHHMTEALWVHQWHNVVDTDLLRRMLRSPEPRARAAATRVLCYWRDRVSDALALLQNLATDEHPRVRLEAVRAASFFRSADAAHIAVAAKKYSTDYYLDYALKETLRQLEPYWQKALLSDAGNSEAMAQLVKSLNTTDLLKVKRTPAVWETILTRGDVADAVRVEALDALAEQRKTSRLAELLKVLDTKTDATPALARLLPAQLSSDLKANRARVAKLTDSKVPDVRQAAWAALAIADDSFDTIWSEASKSSSKLLDLLNGIPLINDPDFRGKAYDRVKPLLSEAKPELHRAAIHAAVSMNRDQDKTFNELANLIGKDQHVTVAAQGIRVLPRASWPKEQGGKVAADVLAWAKKVPANKRTEQSFIETVQVANDLAGLLPKEQARAARKDLRDLSVAVFVIRSVREQMRYDTPRLVVEPGKPFEVIFENDDFMPHNIVFVKPGTREKVARAAERMKPEDDDGRGRAYVPRTTDVYAASKLIEAGQRASITLTAPNEEGVYEYVCTYPGHWTVMWGQLIITRDVDGYLQNNPVPVQTTQAGTEHGHH
jgi:glucose/arabinose dehydrogenase/azurin